MAPSFKSFLSFALVVSAAVSPTVQAAALSPRIANSTGGAEITYSSKGSDVQYPVTLGGVNLLSASALEISAALEAGKFTSVELVDAYLARVDANDRKGLKLRGLIEIAPTARDIAQELDNERSNGTTRSKLHGIPIAIKDNYNTDPSLGMNTTAGSFSLLGQTTVGDAFVVKQLRDAGVIILGKANMNEFAGERGTVVGGDAWSPRGGQMSSSYVAGGFAAGGSPGGSSGGSGVCASSGFATFALGTDTQGSIINPSTRGALYGIRPSTGLTSRTGVVPISSSQDTTGPLAKSVWDSAAALSIIAKLDPEDSYSPQAEPYRHDDYTQFVDPEGLKGLRIGIPRQPYFNQTFTNTAPEETQAIEDVIANLTAWGATVIDPVEFINVDRIKYPFPSGGQRSSGNATTRLLYDVRGEMATYLTTQLVNSTLTTLEDIVNFIDQTPAESNEDNYGQETFIGAIQTGERQTSAEYWLSRFSMQSLYVDEVESLYRRYDLDLILVPSESDAAQIGVIAHAPVGNVPVGQLANGRPIGIALTAKPFDEPTLIKAMAGLEAHIKRPLPATLD